MEIPVQRGPVHEPARPSWDCMTCGDEWPCHARRQTMLAINEPTTLAIVMASYFAEACGELSHGEVSVIHRRFLGWIRDADQRPVSDDRTPTRG